jgi:hypothetical protein
VYRGKNEFKKGYQPTTDFIKDENAGLLCKFPQYFEYVEELSHTTQVQQVK